MHPEREWIGYKTSSDIRVLLLDTPIDTVVFNITVYKGNPNTTVIYNLTEPYSGRTIDRRDTSLTPEQEVKHYTPGFLPYATPSRFTPRFSTNSFQQTWRFLSSSFGIF